MPLKVYAITVDPKEVSSLKTDQREILTTLGSQEDTVAVQLEELFKSVSESIAPQLEVESQLSIEVSGSVSLKAQGGVKYLFFNVGGEAATTANMKVVLSTTLRPRTGTENGK
jgi:hypothetical protein